MAYNQDIDAETMMRVYRVQLFELGHSMAEIDAMNIDDIGDIIGYWAEKNRAEGKLKRDKGSG